jgi:hypothetical protein
VHKYYYLLFQIGVTIIFALSSAQPVVILVHGSFASAAAWSRPGGDFFEALEKQALTLNHKLINFCWSSMPLESEIKKAGESLAKLIASYPAQEEIILIGHSHGGNVILAASSHLTKQEPSTVFEFDKQVGIFVPKPLEDNLMHTFSLMHTTKTITPRHISKVFLLGTPIDTTKFTPDMTVIKNLILFYSDGDRIQSVLGAFNKTLPPHPGRINLKVEIPPLDQRGMAPTHSELHDTSIAHWILYIPEKMQQLMVGNFDKCCYGKDGLVIFQSLSFPIFQLIA